MADSDDPALREDGLGRVTPGTASLSLAVGEAQGQQAEAREDDTRDTEAAQCARLLGQEIGGYRITRLLGRGGMGAVFEARHRELTLRAAVKVMSRSAAGGGVSRQVFWNEARALSAVQHSGLVRLYDVGELADGTLYLQMEYLHGQSLRDLMHALRLGTGALPSIPWVLGIGRQLVTTLGAIHQAGVAHCDLTPSNVFVLAGTSPEQAPQIKLLDLGIARLLSTQQAEAGPRYGTPRYLSPEQADGRSVDARTDLYSLGVLLFELLTGESPYAVASHSASDWLHAHRSGRPRLLRQLRPDAPSELEVLIARLLATEPRLRPSATEIEAVIDRIESTHRGPKTLPRLLGYAGSLVRRPWLWLLASGVFASMVAARHGLRWYHVARAVAQAPVGTAFVPGRLFTMGSTAQEIQSAFEVCKYVAKDCNLEEFEREQPLRKVKVNDFYIDKYEITNQQYANWLNLGQRPILARNGRLVESQGELLIDLYPEHSGMEHRSSRFTVRPGRERHPAVQVSWLGARLYCQDRGMDLPTEAQWELAARGVTEDGRTHAYPWGDEPPSCDGVVVARYRGGACAAAGAGTLSVGTAAQDVSPQGVHDLAGNVREWVLDRFLLRYPSCQDCQNPVAGWAMPSARSAARAGESAAPQEEGAAHAVRGGNWLQNPTSARAAGRSRHSYLAAGIGFRCAHTLTP